MDQVEKDSYIYDAYKGLDRFGDGTDELRKQASVVALLENANSKSVSAEAEMVRAKAELVKAEAEMTKAEAQKQSKLAEILKAVAAPVATVLTTAGAIIFALAHEKTVYENHKENNYITDRDQQNDLNSVSKNILNKIR